MAIGALWYSPVLFGKTWMALMGFNEVMMAEKKKGMAKMYVLNFIGALVMAYVFVLFAYAWNVTDVSGALRLAFWTWLGFVATVMLGSILWEGKPIKLYVLNTVYYLVSLSVMGIIFAFWR